MSSTPAARRPPLPTVPRISLAAMVAIALAPGVVRAAPPPAPPATRVVILGVDHNGAQLISQAQQPAAFRAFIDRVRPDGICIERSPEEFARGDYYEFTFEQQDIVVPYALERHIALHPIDWIPRSDDLELGIGIDLSQPPPIRPTQGFQSFETHPASGLTSPLFYAESESSRQETRDFASRPPAKPRYDYSRRMFMYRTFLQAMRIARAARQHRGGTLLVVVGSLHKDDLERILADEPGVIVVQPSTFGAPAPAELQRGIRMQDRFMIATFNLLGLQSTVAVDWDWLRRTVAELAASGGHEAQLFAIRLDYLTKKITPQDALARYESLERATGEQEAFHWTGVKYRQRLDSSFDPFGNLTVKQRVLLEIARVAHRLGQDPRVTPIEDQLSGQLNAQQAAQLRAYWKPYVLDLP